MTKRVLVPIANGSEEIEAVSIIDTLRRAGAEVVVASVEDKLEVTCSRGIKIVADALFKDVQSQSFDLIALPGGGPGAEKFRDTKELIDRLKAQQQQNLPYAAVCASPAVVFGPNGLLDGKKGTCHPSLKDKFPAAAHYEESRVVVDGNIVTSRGPGTSIEFALALIELLYGKEKATAVGGPMIVQGY